MRSRSKAPYRWLRISLKRFSEPLLERFGGGLVSIVLYGSTVKVSFQPGRSDIDHSILEEEAENEAEPKPMKAIG